MQKEENLKKLKMEKRGDKMKTNKGITLIALVITIIVMLILVVVTIRISTNGGLFKKAGKAAGDTKNAINEEQELAEGRIKIGDKWYASIDDYLEGKYEGYVPTYAEAKFENGVLAENATHTSGEYTAIIPKGFKIIEGINGSTTIEDGLVIQDRSGNEYVWIPVTFTVAEGSEKDANGLYPEFLEVFYRSDWTNNARGTIKYTATSGGSYNEPYANGYTGEDTEYYEMMLSVQENKGFYIGRYEAGSQDASGNPIARTNTSNGTSKVVVQRDQYPYIYVGWGPTRSNYIGDVYYDNNNQGKGALYLSKHMYDDEDIGAVSTLCYGIQWDAMLDFIKDDTHNVTSSKSWGNYNSSEWTITRTTAKFSEDYGKTYEIVPKSGKSKASFDLILLTTGADDVFAAKNIYDVAGNVSEWTSETHPLGYMIHRGQGYRNTESPGAHFRSFINYQFCACSDIRRFPSSTLYKIAKFYINWFTPKGTRDFGTRMPKSEQRDGLFSK